MPVRCTHCRKPEVQRSARRTVGPGCRLRLVVAAEGLTYPHKTVCISRDFSTKQHVAVLSKFKFNEIVQEIPGREFYDEELDDPEKENHTGISKGMRITLEASGHTIHLYASHFISKIGEHKSDAQRAAQASIIRPLPRWAVVCLGMLTADSSAISSIPPSSQHRRAD